jgi:streptomycin 6-kinase
VTHDAGSERLDAYVRRWHVSIERITKTETSLIAFGERDGRAVVLKVARRENGEWRGGELLTAFGGAGMVQALELGDGAVLLERLEPGDDLSTLVMSDRDDEAIKILAGVIARMGIVRPSVPGVMTASHLVPEFQLYRHGCDGLMPSSMVDRAERLFVELCASQTDVRILHGDLHHYNVLFDARHGWLAIDPSGICAELEYEVGASLRNPIDAPALLAQERTVVRRLAIYEERLGLNAERAVRWAFSQAVLAALWPTEEGVGVDMRRPFISAATAMLPLV